MKKIILIVSLLFLTTGCSLYDYMAINKNESVKNESSTNKEVTENQETDEVKEEEYSLTSEQKEKVDMIIHMFDEQLLGEKYDDLTDSSKVLLLSRIAVYLNYNDGYPITTDDSLYLNKKNFEKLAREYFGPDAKVNMVDIPCAFCGKTDYYYDANTETYYFNEDHLGHGASFPIIERKGEKIVKKGDTVSIKYKTLFSNYVDIGAPSSFYKSIDDVFEYEKRVASFEDYCWGDDMDYDCDYDKMFNDIDFNTYSYNFKIDGDNFYFLGYTME